MSANYAPVLNQMVAILEACEPATPALPLQGAWLYPAQHYDISFDVLPVALVSPAINVDNTMQRWSHGKLRHTWEAKVLVMVTSGQIVQDESALEAEAATLPWVDAVTADFTADQTMGGTAVMIGSGSVPGDLLTYRIGKMGWGTQTFFGVAFTIPVVQDLQIAFN